VHDNRLSKVLLLLLLGLTVVDVFAKTSITVLQTRAENQDSLFTESFARDLGSALAEDTAFKVFDLRKRQSAVIDSLLAKPPRPSHAIFREYLSQNVDLALRAKCRQIETDLRCKSEVLLLSLIHI
jgi:hypothetical protein